MCLWHPKKFHFHLEDTSLCVNILTIFLPRDDCKSGQCCTFLAHRILQKMERWFNFFFSPLPTCFVLACPLPSASLPTGMWTHRHLAAGSGASMCCLFGSRRPLKLHAIMPDFLAVSLIWLFLPWSPSDLIFSISYCFCYIMPLCLFCL